MTNGMVYLIDYDDEMVKYSTYKDKATRERIIKRWEKMVGPSFNRMYIHIAPITKDDNGSYIKRPPAVYDNKTPFNLR